MIDNIREKNLENNVLVTMLLDEATSLYSTKGEARAYEVERLKDVFVTSLHMIAERVKDIDSLLDEHLEDELKKEEGLV